MKIIIENLTEQNIEQVIKMETDLCFFHSDNCKLLSEEKVREYNYEEYIRSYINNPNKSLVVAKTNNLICGMASVEIRESLELHKEQKEAYIDNLFIIPKFRRTGIASLLVGYAERYATEKGIGILTVKIYDFNDASQAVFKKCGYHKDYSHYSKTIDKNKLK